MRLEHLDSGYLRARYDDDRRRIAGFQPLGQSSWYFHANDLLRLAKVAYAIGQPIDECRSCLRQATVAYRELFALRGTSFCTQTKYKDGESLSEERIYDDGYTSVDSFNAALAALSATDVATARALVELAGHSPNARMVSPRSEVCTTNEQTLSHALNALLADDEALARHEASKLSVRRGSQVEKQIAAVIGVIASQGDVLTEIESLLFHHEKQAARQENILNAGFWLCLPALGLAQLAIHRGVIERSKLVTNSDYCSAEFFR